MQFTPDLLPGDITGINVYDRQKNEFTLRKGPVFTNILLADELNRATPRTQAGLLECMEERQVTIEGVSYTPGEPFFVIATENPIESAGVFPLPEAQLDRFLIKLSMNLPTKEEELRILELYMEEDPLKSLTAVVSLEELLAARAEAAKIFVHPASGNIWYRLQKPPDGQTVFWQASVPEEPLGFYAVSRPMLICRDVPM